MTEWKPVKDYEGIYEVSSDGQVRSLDRKDSLGRLKEGQIISGGDNGKGYKYCWLYRDGKRKRFYMHRLVAAAFCDGEGEINHINGDKSDNRAANLAWCSHQENILHALGERLMGRDSYGRFATA